VALRQPHHFVRGLDRFHHLADRPHRVFDRLAATKGEAWGKLLLGRVGLARLAPHGHVWVVPERHAGWQVVTPRFVQEARVAGDAVWVFVVDDAVTVRRLRGWGVAGCLSTRPAELIAELTRTGPAHFLASATSRESATNAL
jgi:hypothetical protein